MRTTEATIYSARSVHDIARDEVFCGRPLLIAGAGPSFDSFDFSALPEGVTVFALNHTITKLYQLPDVWWVSNDHDRTFASSVIRAAVVPKLAGYKRWRTITQRKFLPGKLGKMRCIDHRGVEHGPLSWRLPLPFASEVAYYVGGDHMIDHPDWIRNGKTVLELAIEVATLWGFGPIVLVGCDMTMDGAEYYAGSLRDKPTPRRVYRGSLDEARRSVIENRRRWSSHVFIVSDLWSDPPFHPTTAARALRILGGDDPWNRD